MKITGKDKFWIVTDPSPRSILADILFQATLYGLELQVLGAKNGGYRMTDKNYTIHTDETEAKEDAEGRLATR